MKLSISEILAKVDQLPNVEQRKQHLLQHDTPVLREVLRMAYDPAVEFDLPKGEPPYKPSQFPDQHGRLYSEIRKFPKLFYKGGHPNLTPLKREMLFIDMIEALDKDDAKLILAVKDKQMPYKRVSRSLVEKTFPGLIPPKARKQKAK